MPSIPRAAYQEWYAGCNLSQCMRHCETNEELRSPVKVIGPHLNLSTPPINTKRVWKRLRPELQGGFIRPAISGMLKLPGSPNLPGCSVSITGRERSSRHGFRIRSNTPAVLPMRRRRTPQSFKLIAKRSKMISNHPVSQNSFIALASRQEQ